MQAIVLHGKNDLRFDSEYPKPTPKAGEVLLKLTYSSICQTDIEMWQHGMFGSGDRVLSAGGWQMIGAASPSFIQRYPMNP